MRRPTLEELGCLVYNSTTGRLNCLNDVKARLYLPVTVFLAVLIIVGTIGNATVCLVYCKRKTRVSSHYFILYLAALDLVTCVIGMPTEIADLVLPYTFDSPWACKVLRFTHSSTIIASSTILIEVAFDRYYRICQLGRQFTANKARFLCVGAVVLGLVCSWPTFILFGRKTVVRNLNGHVLKGTDCTTDDSMRRTIYPTIYYVFLFSLFGITIVFFAVLYSKIGLTILGRKRVHMGSVTSNTSSSKGLLRSGSRKENAPDPTSSDLSSEQDDGHGASTASNHSNNNNHSSLDCSGNVSTATSTTTLASAIYGSFRRHYGKSGKQPLEDASRWLHPDITHKNSMAITLPPGSRDDIANGGGSAQQRVSICDMPVPHLSVEPFLKESSKHSTELVSAGPTVAHMLGSAVFSPSRKVSRTRIFTRHPPQQVHQVQQQQQLQQHNHHHFDTTDEEDNTPQPHRARRQAPKEKTAPKSSQRQIRVGKTTTVLFAVTLAYILSFLPYLTVMVLRSVIKDLEENLSPVGELAYKLCVKSFFINNAINPLIYSFLNQTFRQDARVMFSKCCGNNNRITKPRAARPVPDAV
ncbi:hypothetical protein Btru_051365 [Bulinus truncatus]|nr:hypothetical protein Btru_051365 [Bulinus truncatus]